MIDGVEDHLDYIDLMPYMNVVVGRETNNSFSAAVSSVHSLKSEQRTVSLSLTLSPLSLSVSC